MPNGGKKLLLAFHESSRYQHCFRVKQIKDICDSLGQVCAESLVCPHSSRKPFDRELTNPQGQSSIIDALITWNHAAALAEFSQQRSSGNIRLETAAPPAIARVSTLPNDVVTDGPGKTMLTLQQSSIRNNSPTDASSNGDRNEVGQAATHAEMEFGEHRGVRVIHDPCRKVESSFNEASQFKVCPSRKILGCSKN